MSISKSILVAAIAAVVVASAGVASAQDSGGTQYVFRMPVKGLHAKAAVCPDTPYGVGSPTVPGEITVPAGCRDLLINVVALDEDPTNTCSFWARYQVQGDKSIKVAFDWSAGVVTAYVNGTEVAAAATVDSGVVSGVANGATSLGADCNNQWNSSGTGGRALLRWGATPPPFA